MSKNITNAWIIDKSPSVTSGSTQWTATPLRLRDHLTLREASKFKFAQHAELITALAVRQSYKEKWKAIDMLTDSRSIANGIAILSGKWKKINWKINRKKLWSAEY